MNEPVLQMRLKKQLSGGRAPHLLQTKKACEILHTLSFLFVRKEEVREGTAPAPHIPATSP